MSSYPSHREMKNQKRHLEQEEYNVTNSEKLVEEETDVLNLPPRKDVHKKKDRKKRKNNDKVEQKQRVENEELEEISETVPTGRRKKKKGFPLVNLLFILFFLIVIIVSTYPLWVDRL